MAGLQVHRRKQLAGSIVWLSNSLNSQQRHHTAGLRIDLPHLVGILSGRNHAANTFRLRMLVQQANCPIDKAVRPDRTGGVQVQDDLRMIILVFGQPVQGMLEDRQIGRAVGGQFRRTQEGGFGSKGRATSAISGSSVDTITRVTVSACRAAAML